ncbi:MAG: nickel pincer cofactor biosynthesis protein LarC [Micromonosporaceae bacterium]|nr:nickel pincer cofactor biosynthesis protein LarC [Micromonosporaceae bacterium]
MRLLWVDAGQGAAGDMFLAALLDAGADEAAVREGLARLPLGAVSIEVRHVRRHGLRACEVSVREPEATGHHHRGLPEILSLLAAGDLPKPAGSFAAAVFERLASAEAEVHGMPVDQVHFHEVGAVDAIVDIAGCALALHSLGLLDEGNLVADAGGQAVAAGAQVVVSPVAVGSGRVRAAHGILPVPAPAVVRLLIGAPIAAHHAEMELCTPTGAALLTTLAHRWGPLPACVPQRVGVGAGLRDPASHPNVLRVVLAEYERVEATNPREDHLIVVEATVDDLDPRLWPEVLDAMRVAGAVDAWCSPIIARKGRPGHVLTVLTTRDRLDAVCLAVFAHTSTLGLRRYPVERLALQRDQVTCGYRGHTISVKRGLLDGRVVAAQPEYDDLRRAALATGMPVRQVLGEVMGAAASEIRPA